MSTVVGWDRALELHEEELTARANSSVEFTRWLFASAPRDCPWHTKREVLERELLLQAVDLSKLGS